MRSLLAKFFRFLFGMGVVVFTVDGCGSGLMRGHEEVFQRLEYVNDGTMLVKNICIQYGEGVFPTGSVRHGLIPDHLPNGAEGFTAPIPKVANVEWDSEDGKHFHVSVPMRSLIKDTKCFYGFRFSFVEDQLNVYVLNKKYDCSKLIELDRIKVYSIKSDSK